MTTFAANLRWLRVQYHLNQEQLALCVGCHRLTVSDWECGRYLPGEDYQRALRVVFGDTALLDVERHTNPAPTQSNKTLT